MSKKYHLNPETGAPGICRAKNGNCPYGGNTGKENHFDTFGEAQIASQTLLSSKHGLLPASEFERPEDFDEQLKEVKELFNSIQNSNERKDNYTDIQYELRTTENVKLLQDVIDGNMYIRDDWETIGPALQNPNLPREFIDKVLNNPDEYHIETQRWIASNPALKHEDLMNLVNNRKDMTTRALAMRNTSLDPDFARDFVKNRADELSKVPWYSMLDNQALDYKEYFRDFQLNLIVKSIESDDSATFKINEAYPDIKFVYEYRKNK